MKKVEIAIEEKLTYHRNMKIEVPEDMTEKTLNEILDAAQNRAQSSSDIPLILEKFGVKTIVHPDESFSSPWDVEIEITDYDFED